MNNCLFNFALHRVLRECRCNSYFTPKVRMIFTFITCQLVKYFILQLDKYREMMKPFCIGKSVACMRNILGDISGEDVEALVIGQNDGEGGEPRSYTGWSH